MAAHKASKQHPESLTAAPTGAKVVPLTRRQDREPSSLTIPEVITELQVSRSTFYYWRQTGKAPRCIKLPNGEIRVRRADLDRWLDSLEEAA
jgi:predicted DNA-binding transcriptional regulator AlpA